MLTGYMVETLNLTVVIQKNSRQKDYIASYNLDSHLYNHNVGKYTLFGFLNRILDNHAISGHPQY